MGLVRGCGVIRPARVYVVTHPEVAVDPSVPVPQWGLSEPGRRRLDRLLALPWVSSLTRIASSDERKAVETASALGSAVQLDVRVDAELGENDRSATGFLPPAEFESVAEEFFAYPDRSVRGWETARDAQRRILRAVERVTSGADGDIVVVSHGGVGTLLQCALRGVEIDRSFDQPGQGSWYAFDAGSRALLHGWRRI